MNCKHIITIGRQFGSGGRELGKALADKLQIKYYDKELISIAAKESGYNPEIFEHVDERATNSLLYSLSMGIYNLGNGYAPMRDMPVNDQLYLLQHKIIRELAAEPCVIVGRCADYILRNNKNLLRLFVYANMEDRINNAVKIHGVPENKAESIIKKTDKTRANYYNFYSNQKWGAVENYDLCVNTSTISRDAAINMICSIIEA
ncbi:MAG: AAA family ATPase [Acutalibacteraceae bacterium]